MNFFLGLKLSKKNTRMGYNTCFEGCIEINKPVDEETKKLLKGLASTRRMRRDVEILAKRLNIDMKKCIELYGEEGEFYFHDDNVYGQTKTEDIITYNDPPKSQPGLWCQWILDENINSLVWDEQDKFYEFEEWMIYLVNILSKRNYILNGEISWEGEDQDDKGTIIVKDNVVSVLDKRFTVSYT